MRKGDLQGREGMQPEWQKREQKRNRELQE